MYPAHITDLRIIAALICSILAGTTHQVQARELTLHAKPWSTPTLKVAQRTATPPEFASAPATEAEMLYRLASRALSHNEPQEAAVLFRWIIRDYPESPSAALAVSQLELLQATTGGAVVSVEQEDRIREASEVRGLSNGRAELVVSQTLLGTYAGTVLFYTIGVEENAIALGTILGTVGGLTASLKFSRSHRVTEAQAGLIYYSQVFAGSNMALWTAAVDHQYELGQNVDKLILGSSLVGIAGGTYAGYQLGRRFSIPVGQVSVVASAGIWTPIVVSLAYSAMTDGDFVFEERPGLVPAANDVALATAVMVLRAYDLQFSRSRVRLINLGGIVGGILGLSTMVLLDVDEGATYFGATTAGIVGGLAASSALTRNWDHRYHPEVFARSQRPSILAYEEGRIKLGQPIPTLTVSRDGRNQADISGYTRKMSVNLVSGSF